jgi:Flp pilus assembly pilin Flp
MKYDPECEYVYFLTDQLYGLDGDQDVASTQLIAQKDACNRQHTASSSCLYWATIGCLPTHGRQPVQTPLARLNSFLNDDRGVTVVEYAIAAGLISATIVVALFALGVNISGIITTLATFLTP